jgi:hypothetical protein
LQALETYGFLYGLAKTSYAGLLCATAPKLVKNIKINENIKVVLTLYL